MNTSSTTETYVVATLNQPEIVCPAWCTVDKQEHLDDLASWEGRCAHSGESIFRAADGHEVTVYLGLFNLPDGSSDASMTAGVTVTVESFGEYMSASDAAAFGKFLAETATSAQAAQA